MLRGIIIKTVNNIKYVKPTRGKCTHETGRMRTIIIHHAVCARNTGPTTIVQPINNVQILIPTIAEPDSVEQASGKHLAPDSTVKTSLIQRIFYSLTFGHNHKISINILLLITMTISGFADHNRTTATIHHFRHYLKTAWMQWIITINKYNPISTWACKASVASRARSRIYLSHQFDATVTWRNLPAYQFGSAFRTIIDYNSLPITNRLVDNACHTFSQITGGCIVNRDDYWNHKIAWRFRPKLLFFTKCHKNYWQRSKKKLSL